MRPKIPALTDALTGHFGPHHAVACRRILAHIDFLNETIAALTEQIDARTAAFEALYTSLQPVPGFDRLTIDVIIAETGADMTRFPTAADLASWSGVCPGSHESAGKRRNVSTIPGNQWLRPALIELVWHLLSTGEVFKDLGDDYFKTRQDPQRQARRLVAQLEELGYAVTLEAAPAISA